MSARAPEKIDLSKYIETHIFGERPHIRGRRIPVANIVRRAQFNHWTVAETAYDFSISGAEVLAAMLYYEEHQEEIDRQEAREAEAFETMKQLNDKD